ncbi:MAG TPA: shikimate dehydrogenase [Persephonella sp.]|uniref:Shikimate dehydrogenase (NADP(+)) n=1 Tax=Persephonella marina (strain DSM 14350 / EX-H1) TaxID=123214 RepID=C0QQB2_PERMH|nr:MULTISPECIES: shikimate dehydrogenase [Persephonella]ACO04504.1 shikimate 5-dehydrogenase [Persephonella marina EX-H1]HCB69536.1 shikimate dehydrogenase [Persephonella sp.]
MDTVINGETEVYGIFGYPVKHSKSPLFQNAAFSYLGINAVYLPFSVKPEDLKNAVEGIRALSIKGVNITVPHKEEVLKLVNEISEEVKYIGASNTIKNIDGYLIAYNTDAYGFIQGLKELVENISGKKVLVIGAGGASRAVVYGLIKEGAEKIYISNRTLKRAEDIIRDFSKLSRFTEKILEPLPLSQIEELLCNVDIIVNTTSVGLRDEDRPLFDYSKIEKRHIVVDIIYRKTPLLKAAEEKGCLWQDGLPMLLYQGARSFEIWTGKKAPINIMKKALSD